MQTWFPSRCRIQTRAANPLVAALPLALCATAAFTARAEVRLPNIIGSNMVLQREADVPLWGWSNYGEHVRVKASWGGPELTATRAGAGLWRVKLRTPAAGGPHTITIRGRNTITLENVLCGEVWLASGQSNMEWPVSLTRNAQHEIAAARHPQIRLFNVANTTAILPRTDCDGSWIECSPQTIAGFGATAYFFGRALHEELHVPIGLIEADWGGTPAQAWISAETLKDWPQFAEPLRLADLERREPGALEQRSVAETTDWWDALESREPKHWRQPDFDDSTWSQASVPGEWSNLPDLKTHDGLAFFRCAAEIPHAWVGKPLRLELGPIDDMDTTWVSGERVGGIESIGFWNKPREYEIPAAIVKNTRLVIAVRVLDPHGLGGFTGRPDQLRLRLAHDEQAPPLSLAGVWRYRAGPPMSALPPLPDARFFNAGTPTALFNGMIAPLAPFGLRGVIWYQGEANRGAAAEYRTLFPALIADWRRHWGQGDFPFYFVQIAPFRYDGDTGESAALRDAQRSALAVANTGMVVTTDIGDLDDIHPANKQDVGRRLALWALAKTYGRSDLVFSGPLYESMRVEGATVRVRFEHASKGLIARNGPLTHFQIAGADRVFVAATAEIDGADVVVSSARVSQPVAVRFAWSTDAVPNLFNSAGLPAAPFRTDDW